MCLLFVVLAALPGAAFAEGSCPNEQLRVENQSTSLPDCRAYELVTPPQKNGQPPVTNNVGIAANGPGITFSSLGAFGEPGNDSTTEGGEYVATRNADGWLTSAVNPSALEFQGGQTDEESSSHESLDFSSDLERSLVLQAPRGAKPIDVRFYRRDVSSGALEEVGPLLSPESMATWGGNVNNTAESVKAGYLGASADLSHVLFSLLSARSDQPFRMLWPGDTTLPSGKYSLYEYVGSGAAEPELVGISNQSTLAAAASSEHKAHINEAAELISQCGAVLGGVQRYGDRQETKTTEEAYNAISHSGGTVIFTALEGGCLESLLSPILIGSGPVVAEIYARIDRDHSVKISEPSAADCVECSLSEVAQLKYNGMEFEGTAPEKETAEEQATLLNPIFQGASEDGSRVFFMSRQQLFAGTHGEMGRNLYEYNFNGVTGHKLALIAPELAPVFQGGVEAPGGVVRTSENGSRVYLVSDAVLPGTGPNEFDNTPQVGARNLYVYDTVTHTTTFITVLSDEDQPDWRAADTRPVEATPNGRYLLFPSTAALTPDAAGTSRQLYRYDSEPTTEEQERGVPRLVRVSVGAPGSYECQTTKTRQNGYNCDGNAAAEPSSEVFGPLYQRGSARDDGTTDKARVGAVAISDDGSEAYFQSPAALTPGSLNDACAYESFGECVAAAQNVYEWHNGQIRLISDGRDEHPLFAASATKLVGAAPSGTDVYFTTADQLVRRDTDSQIDLYDAREGGGFPAPASSSSCQGSGCQGSGSVTPAFPTPGSASLFGTSSVSPNAAPTPKPKGKTPAEIKAEQLVKALKACGKKPPKQRRTCTARARSKYGPRAVGGKKARGHGKSGKRQGAPR